MKAAVYCRVSTEAQEREGTSLLTQAESCVKYCQGKGYTIAYQFAESWSGLSLDRPRLNELRELVRSRQIDVVVIHCLDRLSRDPVHGVIITEEIEKHGIRLEAVTENVDSTDLGKLITYIRQYAGKVEVAKIKERTARGKRARIEKEGKLPCGRGIFYGYDYDKVTGRNIANSTLDTVRMMGRWVIEEGLSTNEICRRLTAKGVPAPKGGTAWRRSTVHRLLKNPSYAGRTFANRTTHVNGKQVGIPQAQWVELPDLVDRAPFTWDEWLLIQHQLKVNRDKASRNQKHVYLLRGMVYCKTDGYKLYGFPCRHAYYYRCSSKYSWLGRKPCGNSAIKADWLEDTVWGEIAKALQKPELVIAELQKQRDTGAHVARLEGQIKQSQKRLAELDEVDTRYLRLYGCGATSLEKYTAEHNRVTADSERLKQEIGNLEKRLAQARELTWDVERVTEALADIKANLGTLTTQQKRKVLEALKIRVMVDDHSVDIEGEVIPKANIVSPGTG